jgi:DNA-binding PadR family transcriptional regulator
MIKPTIAPQLGTLQTYILSTLWNQEMFGLEIIKHLKLRRYIIKPNQLYPALKRLVQLNALTSRNELSMGTTRIYYKITETGKKLLISQFMDLLDLFQDIMLEKVSFLGAYSAEVLKLKAGMRILDLSKEFFEPFIMEILEKISSEGTYYIGAKDTDFLELYQDRIEHNHHEKTIYPMLIESNKINLPNNSIDAVLAFYTLRNKESLEILQDVKRILKVGGKGLVVDWPMSNEDVRRPMIESIFPQRRGLDPIEFEKDIKKLGFKCIKHTEKAGITVIEFFM